MEALEPDVAKSAQPSWSDEFKSRALDAILRIDHIMSTIDDLRLLLSLVMKEAEHLTDAEASSILLYDESTNDLYFEVVLSPDEKIAQVIHEIRVPMGESSIAGYSALHRVRVNVENAYNDPRFFRQSDDKSTFKTRNILAVPMLRKDKLIGVLEVLNKRNEKPFSEDDGGMLEVLTHHATIAIENARLFEANLKAERLAAIGQAVAGLAHYVKNIVTGMRGSSSLVECAVQEKSYDMLPRAWDILKRSTERVSVLVQDMLTYSKERKLDMSMGDVNCIVGDVVSLYVERAKKSGIEIKAKFDENIPSIPIDETGIHRCFMNFVGNAIDAVAWPDRKNPDPGKIEIESSLGEEGKSVTIMVRDNGIGMDQKVLDKIWEPFWSTKGSRGTGLGLAVTKKILTEHGARVETKSAVGKGTEFRIQLSILYLDELMENAGPTAAKS